MTLNFPSNPADGEKYSYTDPITNTTTTYVWRKEAKIWTAQLEDANLETKFVEVAGDNMTGNLTLGTDKITLNASGKLLVGTTTEGYATYADKLTIADSSHCGVTIRSGASSQGNIYFSDATSGAAEYAGIVHYRHDVDAMAFGVANGVERMRINSTGKVGIGTDNPLTKLHIGGVTEELRFGVAGAVAKGGVKYSASGFEFLDLSVQGTTTGYGNIRFFTGKTPDERMCITDNGTIQLANNSPGIQFGTIPSPQPDGRKVTGTTLDDYEEGTWTPSLGGDGDTVYNLRQGFYTKIGNFVDTSFYVSINSIGSGNRRGIINLPFKSIASTGGGACIYWVNLSLNVCAVTAYVYNSNVIDFYSNAGPANGVVLQDIFKDGSAVQGHVQYYTND